MPARQTQPLLIFSLLSLVLPLQLNYQLKGQMCIALSCCYLTLLVFGHQSSKSDVGGHVKQCNVESPFYQSKISLSKLSTTTQCTGTFQLCAALSGFPPYHLYFVDFVIKENKCRNSFLLNWNCLFRGCLLEVNYGTSDLYFCSFQDKTFGLKNKKGAKQQKFIKNVTQQVKHGQQSARQVRRHFLFCCFSPSFYIADCL